jgi:hypothetical protein
MRRGRGFVVGRSGHVNQKFGRLGVVTKCLTLALQGTHQPTSDPSLCGTLAIPSSRDKARRVCTCELPRRGCGTAWSRHACPRLE